MYRSIIDAHIHLDMYSKKEQIQIVETLDLYNIQYLITVSSHLESSKENLFIAKNNDRIQTAFGYHPEQPLPTEGELAALDYFMEKNKEEAIAIGEVGLPHYLKRENSDIKLDPYIALLEFFIKKAKQWNKPVVLHAIYEDASIVCDLLEKYSVENAHFHWFKGNMNTIERMILNGYYISITPDIFYSTKIKELVRIYPLSKMMVETDGPWQFDGPFKQQTTHPRMIHYTLKEISKIKRVTVEEVYDQIYRNTCRFFSLSSN